MTWLRTRWKGGACQVGGIAICTIVAKNYMPTTASIVMIPCGAWGLVAWASRVRGGAVRRSGKWVGKMCRIDFENCGLYFRLNDFKHVNGPDDEFMLSLSKSDGDGVNRIP
ncbi:hypothetical protein [Burkholderia sp. BCC0419]|uniref:hypothetical protein n=1 Tax=Burkholderia sp. BCC0419 TaxID=486878 RepID=UPI00158F509C|nr:hypothetical protein [Burkholderia sp. BCC0419]